MSPNLCISLRDEEMYDIRCYFGSVVLMSLGYLHCLVDPCQVIGYGNLVYTSSMMPGFLQHVVTKRIQIDFVAVGSSFSSSAAKLQMHILLAVCVGTLSLSFFSSGQKIVDSKCFCATGELSVKRLSLPNTSWGFSAVTLQGKSGQKVG